MEGLAGAVAQAAAVGEQHELLAVLLRPRLEIGEVFEIAVEIAPYVVAVEAVGQIRHAGDGADAHVDGSSDVDRRELALDHPRDGGGCGGRHLDAADVLLRVAQDAHDLLFERDAHGLAAVAVRVEEDVEPLAHRAQPRQVVREAFERRGVQPAVFEPHGRAPAGVTGPGEEDLGDGVAERGDEVDEGLFVRGGELVADGETDHG